MDKFIISFNSKADAQKFADDLHADHVALRASEGYTIINNEIVSRINGADNLEAQRTTAWTSVTDEPDGTFSIPDESGSSLFDSCLAKQSSSYIKKTVTVAIINNV